MSRANSQNSTAMGGAGALPISSSQTRRGILRALAAAPVVALVPAIPVLASASYGSDTFATLGAQLQEQWAAYASNRPIYEETHGRANELLYEALIQTPHELDINSDETGGGEYWAASRRAEAQVGFDKVSELDVRAHHAVYLTTKAIEQQKPATIADLAALANVCAVTNPDLWEGSVEDLDWDMQYFRMLVDEVLRLAGTKLVLEGLPLPQTLNQDARRRAHKFWEGKPGARLSESRKNDIFKAFMDSIDEIGSPAGVAPEVFRERALRAINARLSCTEKELTMVVDEALPIMERSKFLQG